MQSIDLKPFTGQDSIVMSGRPRGEMVRKSLELDVRDSEPEECDVLVPPHIVSLNSSFFLGLFGPSVRTLGRDNFFLKYHFKGRPTVLVDVERGARDALETSNPLK